MLYKFFIACRYGFYLVGRTCPSHRIGLVIIGVPSAHQAYGNVGTDHILTSQSHHGIGVRERAGQRIVQYGRFRCRSDACHGVDICLCIARREVFGANLRIVIEVRVEEVHIDLRVETNHFNGLG